MSSTICDESKHKQGRRRRQGKEGDLLLFCSLLFDGKEITLPLTFCDIFTNAWTIITTDLHIHNTHTTLNSAKTKTKWRRLTEGEILHWDQTEIGGTGGDEFWFRLRIHISFGFMCLSQTANAKVTVGLVEVAVIKTRMGEGRGSTTRHSSSPPRLTVPRNWSLIWPRLGGIVEVGVCPQGKLALTARLCRMVIT